jgi:uroporphyrinogen-III synthase/REP element-mobilizing transposase RayT
LNEDEKREYYEMFSERIQKMLDAGEGNCLLKDRRASRIVAEAMKYFAGKRYLLGEWVVMPNHVHVILTPINGSILPDILKSWKTFTAREINKLSGKGGALWQHESYDHIIRNQSELRAIEKYIRENPSKAGIKIHHASFLEEVAQSSGLKALRKPEACATPGTACKPEACATSYDWIIITSPSSVKVFVEILKNQKYDFRRLPKIMVCGSGTADEFRKRGIIPDISALEDFGTQGLLNAAKFAIKKGDRILRLKSDKADNRLSCELRKTGAVVVDEILYKNIPLAYEKLPDFDSIIFASSSAVESFRKNWGLEILKDRITVVIGEPTLKTLKKLKCKSNIILSKEATINGCIESLAEKLVERKIFLQDSDVV